MSEINHRRGGRGQDNGPRWENRNPSKGCNSTHVARSRSKWKRIKNRAMRRVRTLGGFLRGRPVAPDELDEWGDDGQAKDR